MHLHLVTTPDPSAHLISTKRAANACGLTYSTFRFLRSMGLAPIPAERKGGRAFYVHDEVIAWNEARLANKATAAELDALLHDMEIEVASDLRDGAPANDAV